VKSQPLSGNGLRMLLRHRLNAKVQYSSSIRSFRIAVTWLTATSDSRVLKRCKILHSWGQETAVSAKQQLLKF
jgi:hypothetical protein